MTKLTDTHIRKSLKPGAKPVKHADGGGLTLTVNPNGSKLWSLRYRLHGKPSALSLGKYPDVSLVAARAAAGEARKLVQAGRDPVAARQTAREEAAESAGDTFRVVAEDWMRVNRKNWCATTARKTELRLTRYVFPHIGDRHVSEITVRSMAATSESWFRKLVETAPTMANQSRRHMSAIFEHAVTTGLLTEERNPAHYLRSFVAGQQTLPHAAALTIETARAVLAAVESRTVSPTVRLLNRWLVLTNVRSAEARGARWCEIAGLDGDAPTWTIPAERMKGRKTKKRAHVVPLAPAAVEVLRAVRRHCTISGEASLIFAIRPGHTLSEQSLQQLYAKAALPVPHVPHGWRAAFSTAMNERFPADRAPIDMMLAHVPSGGGLGDIAAMSSAEKVYNRATHLTRRRELAGVWAELILRDAPSAFGLVGQAEPVRLVA